MDIIMTAYDSLSVLPMLHRVFIVVLVMSLLGLTILFSLSGMKWWSNNYIAKNIYVSAFYRDESLAFQNMKVNFEVIKGTPMTDAYVPLTASKLNNNERDWRVMIENKTGQLQEQIYVKLTFDKLIRVSKMPEIADLRGGGTGASFISFSIEKLHPNEKTTVGFISAQEIPESIDASLAGTTIPSRIVKITHEPQNK